METKNNYEDTHTGALFVWSKKETDQCNTYTIYSTSLRQLTMLGLPPQHPSTSNCSGHTPPLRNKTEVKYATVPGDATESSAKLIAAEEAEPRVRF